MYSEQLHQPSCCNHTPLANAQAGLLNKLEVAVVSYDACLKKLPLQAMCACPIIAKPRPSFLRPRPPPAHGLHARAIHRASELDICLAVSPQAVVAVHMATGHCHKWQEHL